MLYQHGQLRNSSVFTHFHSYSSTATSSASNKWRTVPERIGQNEEQTSTNGDAPDSYLALPQILRCWKICIIPVVKHETINYLSNHFC